MFVIKRPHSYSNHVFDVTVEMVQVFFCSHFPSIFWYIYMHIVAPNPAAWNSIPLHLKLLTETAFLK